MLAAEMELSRFDLVVIVAYLLGIMVVGVWVGFRRHASRLRPVPMWGW
jgi:hypothetical protein